MPAWQVGISSDDCLRRLATVSYWSLSDVNFIAGADSATSYQYGAGARFTNITIAQGTTIIQAYLTLKSWTGRSGTVVRTRISAEDVDDAPTFADDATAFDTRWATRTTARVDWDNIPTWGVGGEYSSPEIKTVIQEIVDRAGWVSGNAIVIFWEDFEDRSDHNAGADRIARSYDYAAGEAPKLTIVTTLAAVRSFGVIID